MKNINEIRADFPILGKQVYGKPLVYFDNGATTQKPQCVLDALNEVYTDYNGNIHRGVHYLSDASSEAYEHSREKVSSFLNAQRKEEVLFTSGTTGSINGLAFSFGERYIKPGDEIIVSHLEHHANIVPWQMMCERKGASLKVIPLNDSGEIIFEEYLKLLSPRTRLVAVAQASNALGTILPLKEIIAAAHSGNIPVLIDGAQGIQHGITDMQSLDCDFYVFSGHKIYGPNGIGILYGKEKWLREMPPFQGGGDMVDKVTFEKTTYAPLPNKFEAGTPAIAQMHALGAAIDYVTELGLDRIARHEHDLLVYANSCLAAVPGFRVFGTRPDKAAVLSFALDCAHPHDIAQVLDNAGVSIRAGHHCAQPLMERFGVPATARASFGLYNTRAEVDVLVAAVTKVVEMFGE